MATFECDMLESLEIILWLRNVQLRKLSLLQLYIVLTLKDYIRDKFDTDIILSKMYRIGDTLGNINGRQTWQVEWQNPNCCKSGDEHGLEVFVLVGDKAYEIAYYGGPNYLNHFPEFLKMIYSLKIK